MMKFVNTNMKKSILVKMGTRIFQNFTRHNLGDQSVRVEGKEVTDFIVKKIIEYQPTKTSNKRRYNLMLFNRAS